MSDFGTRQRLSIGVRTLLGAALTVTAAFLVIALSNWRYARVDLSAAGRNTLDESVLEIIDNLPEKVRIDVFARELQGAYAGVHRLVLARLQNVLSVAEESRRNQLEVRYYGPADLEEAKARQLDLGVEGANIVVFSNAGRSRRAVQRIYGDLAVVDWGTPSLADLRSLRDKGVIDPNVRRLLQPGMPAQPAQLSIFRGEEVLAESLLKVADTDAFRVYLCQGQGEPDPANLEPDGLSKLHDALLREGFELEPWNPSRTPEVPGDCDVLVMLGGEQPYPPGTMERVRAWAKDAGRLVAVPSLRSVDFEDEEALPKLLLGFGIVTRRGLACEPLLGVDPSLSSNADPAVRVFDVEQGLLAGHPITQPLRERGRKVRVDTSVSFQRGTSPTPLKDLVTTSPNAWLDLPPYDFYKDHRRERRGRFSLVMEAELLAPTPRAGEPDRRGRLLAVGSVPLFLNQHFEFNADFLLNAFNQLVERDHRIRVSPLPIAQSRVDLDRSDVARKLSWSLYLGLPGLCACVGLALAWRRRS